MTELQLSRRLAQIVVYGHLLLFAYGFLIWQFGTLEDADTAQLLLMGSPLLALVGLAAFRFIMRGRTDEVSPVAEATKAQMAQVVCYAFLAALFAAYTTTFFHTTISADGLKLIVGIIETGLGAYIGVIKDTFFPEQA